MGGGREYPGPPRFGDRAALPRGVFLHVAMVDAAPNRAQVAGYEYALFVLVAIIAQFFLGTGALGFSRDR
jgi:hypothetical protein